MTKTFTHKGKRLTEKRAEKIAREALADLDAMIDDEARKRTRPPGSLAKAIGRPRVGGAMRFATPASTWDFIRTLRRMRPCAGGCPCAQLAQLVPAVDHRSSLLSALAEGGCGRIWLRRYRPRCPGSIGR
jgi:hypothetical protein